jgi:carboxyl-terminal processing protease
MTRFALLGPVLVAVLALAQPPAHAQGLPELEPTGVALLPGALHGPSSPMESPSRFGLPAPDSLHAEATFEMAWTRIRDTHYDPEMEGLDWEGVREELHPRAAAANSADELREVLRAMLDRLGDSHFVLIPRTASDPEAVQSGSGELGMEVRWLNHEVLVTRVDAVGPAGDAGIRPGTLLAALDGRPFTELISQAVGEASDDDLPPDQWFDGLLAAHLRGPVGDTVTLEIVGEGDRTKTVELELTAPPGDLVQFGHLPPFRLQLHDEEIHRPELMAPVALIRFNGWFPQLADPLAEAVDRHRDAAGMILDLRGNPGGVGGMAMGVSGHFIDERLELGTMTTRETTMRFVVNPQRIAPDGRRVSPYAGPVAILLDRGSGSTTEIFAGGLQALERARIFGETSAGQVLPAVITELPSGDRLMHAVADFIGPDGIRLEGRGVLPDIEVPLSRASLLEGGDPVLEAALMWIFSGTPTSNEATP